jgi:hypothetical protein
MELDGEDLRREPIEVRKATLKGLLRRSRSGIAYNRHFEAIAMKDGSPAIPQLSSSERNGSNGEHTH